MINVIKPFLPPMEEYIEFVKGIYQRNWLTNDGPLVKELELRLKEYLTLPDILYLSNGTIALQIAIRALDLKGEIITTPFSYVATTSSIVWENCKPVYVDIDRHSLNIDASKIEAAITENTSAILATHVYGNPSDIDAIDVIAKKHGLKVIYDGAQSFGTLYRGKSVFAFGDISTASFHATKIFHTVEGGAVISGNTRLMEKMGFMRNFGHNGPGNFEEVGINGKNSEFHAAIGLSNFKYVDDILERMQALSAHYDLKLEDLNIYKPAINANACWNHAYYPIVFESEAALLKAMIILEEAGIFGRRYFYPSLNQLKYVDQVSLPIAEDVSKKVFCLPFYYDLCLAEIDLIAELLLKSQNNSHR